MLRCRKLTHVPRKTRSSYYPYPLRYKSGVITVFVPYVAVGPYLIAKGQGERTTTISTRSELGNSSPRPQFLSRVLDCMKKRKWETVSTVEIFFALAEQGWLVAIFNKEQIPSHAW